MNVALLLLPQRYVFSSKSQRFKVTANIHICCCCYHKGTYFQANHNCRHLMLPIIMVVVATTKVRIFKQITTRKPITMYDRVLLLLPQRYVFSSKSQRISLSFFTSSCCCCYHKGTYFQANHNSIPLIYKRVAVVVATTKVRIFKQITTLLTKVNNLEMLLLLPQRYVFSSKSQLEDIIPENGTRCCCYHKGTYFQANHNYTIYPSF